MGMWIAVGILVLLTLWLIGHSGEDAKKAPPVEEPRRKVKITVSTPSKNESVLANLQTVPPESCSKGIHVAESEIEKWLKQNPSLRNANKL